MRISSNMAVDNFIVHQQRLNSELAQRQTEIITQKSINNPSDDPLAAARILKFVQTEERQEQVLENLSFARDFMNEGDVALDDVFGLLDRIKELSLGVINSVALPDEREAALTEIDSITNTLVRVANKTYLGMHIFGGRDLSLAPAEATLGGVLYSGDPGYLQSRLDIDGQEEFTLTADDVFVMLSDRVLGSDLNPQLQLETRLDELAGAAGEGVRLGVLRLQEAGAVGSFTVDLNGSTSVGQIIDRINAAAEAVGSNTRVDLNDTADGLRVTPGAELTISSLDNSTVAQDLGLLIDDPTSTPISGPSLQRKIMATTPVAELLGGAGLDLSETFTIRNGSQEVSVDLSAAETVQDVLRFLNKSGIGIRADIAEDGRRLAIRNEVSGISMSILDEAGTLAGSLGLLTFDSQTALDDLNGGDGVLRNEGEDDIRINTRNGSSVLVNLDDALTVQDVIDRINTAASDAGVGVEAELSTTGEGITLADQTAGTNPFELLGVGDFDVRQLGFAQATSLDGTQIIGSDAGAVKVDGMFNAIEELRRAILEQDTRSMTSSTARIDEFVTIVSRVQGQLGARVRDVELRIDQTQQAVDATAAMRTDLEGVSLEEALVRFQTVQNALQASLLAGGQSLNLTLLDFLR